MRAGLLRAAAFVVATLSAAAMAAEPIVVRDDRGNERRFAAPPRRVVSMLPSLTETVWVLGGGARLVGVDRYSNWPAGVAQLPHLGGLDDAQIEAIAALKPDVVLASTSSRAVERLEALGFLVVQLKSETYADVRHTLDVVARLLGTPEAGEREWAQLQHEIDAAAARVPPAMRGQHVYFEVGEGPYAAGAASFIGETLARLGLVNIVPRELGPFPKLNPEFIVRARPELIMGPLREQASMAERPGWANLPAIRLHAQCGFDSAIYEMMIRPGPRMGEAAGAVTDCLVKLGPGR